MPEDDAKENRILHVKIRVPSSDAGTLLASMIRSAAPMYQAFGDARIRLLRNADDHTQFLQVIEYKADPVFEQSRQKMVSDPRTQSFVQGWRALFPGAIDVDVYEDVTND